MHLNADFSRRVVVKFDATEWVATPMPGVERKMLDRIGGEIARATSIVRYAPGSAFSSHVHDGGEEYLVLDGVFRDEHGDFPKGTYVRNPPTSQHTPSAPQGATILVKLHQFDPDDRTQVRVDTAHADEPEVLLHADRRETVRLETWAPGTTRAVSAPAGMELFVLAGGFTEGGDRLEPWDWMRLPPGSVTAATAGPEGVRVWVKSGHLREVRAPG